NGQARCTRHTKNLHSTHLGRRRQALLLHANSFSFGASLGGKTVSRRADECAASMYTTGQTRIFAASSILLGAQVQPQPQKKVARVYRIEGSIVLYRSGTRIQSKPERSLLPAEPSWSMVLRVPLFLRTLLRLVFVCRHRHKGPPITLRESIPSNLPGCRSVYG